MSAHVFRSARRSVLAAVLAGMALVLAAPAIRADAGDELSSLSLEELMEIEVTSVSKRPQRLSEAPAAITVLTGEEILRAGHTSIPEALRMVPGLHVARIDANMWAITARGFNGRFANKLLVLIDGRSVYTPLFSGVYWSVQDVPLEDVDRVEVIRGPGGTLWGANAVNGVINIITKPAAQTRGLLVSAGTGSHERAFGTVRYGGAVGEDLHYRVYGRGFDRDAFENLSGGEARDGWSMGRAGFRMDWDANASDQWTLQGDVYRGEADQSFLFAPGRDRIDMRGGNVIARFTRARSDRSRWMVQGYYDRSEREEGLAAETRDTFDLELQHDYRSSDAHLLTWGLNYRVTSDRIAGTPFASFSPNAQTDNLTSLFVQSQRTLVPDRLVATVGSKFEYNEYTGFELQPSARVAWTPSERHTVWSAVSRAVRTPSRADAGVDLALPAGVPGVVLGLQGNRRFQAEDLLAYELGYRGVLAPDLTLDVATFYFDYDDLRSIELTGPPAPDLDPTSPLFGFVIQPAQFDNRVEGHAYGLEVESSWRPVEGWKLTAGWTLTKLQLGRKAGSTDTTSERTEDDHPAHQLHLRSSWDLPGNVQMDAALYYVGAVRGQGVPSYWRGDLRLGWKPRPDLEIGLVGQNLFDHAHQEYNEFFTVPTAVPRSVYLGITWRR